MKPFLALALLALPACSLVNLDSEYPNQACRAAMYDDPTVKALQQQQGTNTSLYLMGERMDLAKRTAYNRCMAPTGTHRYGVAPVAP